MEWNSEFSKEEILMDNKHSKKCQLSLTHRGTQIKTTL